MLTGLFTNNGVNEFYQKGCQEKKLRLDRGSRFLLDIEPTRTNISGEVWCSFS
jgi:hypothetical protein